MRTRIKVKPQIWNAPKKEERFIMIWERIKSDIKTIQINDTLRNIKQFENPNKGRFIEKNINTGFYIKIKAKNRDVSQITQKAE